MSVLRKLSYVSLLVVATLGAASGQRAAVRAVLFYSPACPHCHTVIRDDLPGLFERYGGAARVYYDAEIEQEDRTFYLVSNGELEILLVNIARPQGNELFWTATEALEVPEERQGVPRLVIGDSVLVGSFEIPHHLPGLIESGRVAGGIDWPAISGLQLVLADLPRPPSIADPEAGEEATQPGVTEEAVEPEVPEEAGAPEESQAPSDSQAAEPEGPAASAEPRALEPEETETQPSDEAARPAPSSPTREGAVHAEGAGDTVESGSTLAPAGKDTAPAAALEGGEPAALGPRKLGEEVEGAPPGNEVPAAATDLDVVTETRPSMIDLYRRDTVGNTLSVIVLVGMLASLLGALILSRAPTPPRKPGMLIPALAIAGAAVAVYLTYVESSGAQAVCGPVGDCNAVQASEYARLFGAIPIGAIGLAGYIGILAAWAVGRLDSPVADWGRLGLLGFALVGVVFSIYLTFLEPFVIGATCAWCLASAVAITLLLWLSVRPGVAAWRRLRRSAA